MSKLEALFPNARNQRGSRPCRLSQPPAFSTLRSRSQQCWACSQPQRSRLRPRRPTRCRKSIITGSRIAQTGAQGAQPLSVITSADIERTGLASLGEILSQLTTSGSALNTKFNSSGNFGYPPDGGGIGAGSAQVDLRNLDSKRVLVLVDGVRWVNESSASGVSGSADLNTIPLAIIERIEVLEDGASAIYGSDAIAGVVNVITRKKFDGAEISGYVGEYSKGGRTTQAALTIGGSTDKLSARIRRRILQSGGDQLLQMVAVRRTGAACRARRRKLGDTSRPRHVLRSARGGAELRILHTGPGKLLRRDAQQWHHGAVVGSVQSGTGRHLPQLVGSQDRFNFAPFNLLLTPSERKSIFTNITYDANENVTLHAKGLYNNRPVAKPSRAGTDLRRTLTGYGRPCRYDHDRRQQSVQPLRDHAGSCNQLRLGDPAAARSRPAYLQSGREYLLCLGGPGRNDSRRQRLEMGHHCGVWRQQGRADLSERLQHRQDRDRTRRCECLQCHSRMRASRSVRRAGTSDDAGDDQLHSRDAAGFER